MIGSALGGVIGNSIFNTVKSLFTSENALGEIQAVLLLLITAGVFVYMKKKTALQHII